MATSITETPDSNIYLARPFHALDLKAFYADSDAFADTAQLETDTDAIIDALPLTEPEKTAAKAAINGAVATSVPISTYWEVLDEINVDSLGVVQADNTTFPPSGLINVCPQCLGVGKNTGYDADGESDGVFKISDVCDGYGFTDVPYVKDPNTAFIVAPAP